MASSQRRAQSGAIVLYAESANPTVGGRIGWLRQRLQSWLNRHTRVKTFLSQMGQRLRSSRIGKWYHRHPRLGLALLAFAVLPMTYMLITLLVGQNDKGPTWPPLSVSRYEVEFQMAYEGWPAAEPALLAAIATVETCGNPELRTFENRTIGLMGSPIWYNEENPLMLEDPGVAIHRTAEQLAIYGNQYPIPEDPTDPANAGYLSYQEYLAFSHVVGPLGALKGITAKERQNYPSEALRRTDLIVGIYEDWKRGSSETYRTLLEQPAFREMCEDAEEQRQEEVKLAKELMATEAASAKLTPTAGK